MLRERKRKLPPIQTWTEVIDERTVAGIALAREHRSQRTWVGLHYIRRLAVYQRSEFVILERKEGERIRSYRERSENEAQLKLVLACPAGGHNLEFSGYWENDEKA